jgi:hypothetical protein
MRQAAPRYYQRILALVAFSALAATVSVKALRDMLVEIEKSITHRGPVEQTARHH